MHEWQTKQNELESNDNGLFNIQGTTTKMSPACTQYHHDSPPSVDATSVILVSDFASELGLEVVNFLLDANLTRHLKENV